MRRVMIVGNSGSGKSTLARKLGEQTGFPVIHIDRLYRDNDWKLKPLNERRHLMEQAVSKPEWIIEGNNSSTFDLRIAKADTLIFLDTPTWLCLVRVLRRVFQNHGEIQSDMPQGCPERVDWGFMKWIARFSATGRPKILLMMKETQKGITVHHLRNRNDVEKFLNAL